MPGLDFPPARADGLTDRHRQTQPCVQFGPCRAGSSLGGAASGPTEGVPHVGLFDELRRALDAVTPVGITDPVAARGQLISCSRAPHAGVSGTCSMRIVVRPEAGEAYRVDLEEIVRTDRWPQPGQILPVVVSRADPSRARVDWDRVPRLDDLAGQRADALIEALNSQAADPGAQDLWVVDLGGADTADHGDKIRRVEQLLARDIDADGVVGTPAADRAAHTPEPRLSQGMVAQLERLTALHGAGALSADEYTAAKRRVIDGSD